MLRRTIRWRPSAPGGAGHDKKEDDEDDRHRLEQHALAHVVLLPLSADVLALCHGHDATNKDVGGRAHGEEEQDDEDRVHDAALLVAKCETKRKLAAEKAGYEPRTVHARFAHRRERRSEIALG